LDHSLHFALFLFLLLYHPDQGDIVGREYIISSKFMPPYGILLADSTIIVICITNAFVKLVNGPQNRTLPHLAPNGAQSST
jgi:hypothetical protein